MRILVRAALAVRGLDNHPLVELYCFEDGFSRRRLLLAGLVPHCHIRYGRRRLE